MREYSVIANIARAVYLPKSSGRKPQTSGSVPGCKPARAAYGDQDEVDSRPTADQGVAVAVGAGVGVLVAGLATVILKKIGSLKLLRFSSARTQSLR